MWLSSWSLTENPSSDIITIEHEWSSIRQKRTKVPQSKNLRVARLQSKFCDTKDFGGCEFLTKNAPIFSPDFLAFILWSKKIPPNSHQISHEISLQNIYKFSPTSFCRGVRGRNRTMSAICDCDFTFHSDKKRTLCARK